MDQQRTGYNRPNAPTAQGQADSSQQARREIQISQTTKDKAEAAREFIEKRYSKLKQEEVERKENWEMLQKEMDNMGLTPSEKERIKHDIMHKEAVNQREKRKKMSTRDFEPIAIIGRGAFGEVRLCRWKTTGEVVAMKKMNKSEMEKKNQLAHVRAERNILANAQNPWIVELKCSFQDDRYLYLVMEYLAGGDLMTLLMKKDILTEDEAKFYMAEAILAVASVHKLNYIHRDLKPDNILLDAKGHLKLSDFGLCKHTDIKPRFEFKKMDDDITTPNAADGSNLTKRPQYTRNRKKVFTIVGTPDYIAPEVFGQKGYTETVDWWSLGTILFEMLVGYPPFLSDNSTITCKKIMNWKSWFVIPPEANLSPAAVDLLKRLICDANERLGVNGVEEIKLHPFFAGVDWKRIREKKAPYIPELKSDIDTSNFDPFEEEEPWYVEDTTKTRKVKKAGNFIGYTFKRDFENQRPLMATALESLESYKSSQPRQKTQQAQRAPIENLETHVSENKEYRKELPIYNDIEQKSASNMSNALNSITGNYASAQPKKQTQGISPYHLQNQQKEHQYTTESYYSNNYPSTKSSKIPVSTKQTFYNLPEAREKAEYKLRQTGQPGEGIAKKPTTPSSYIRPPGSNMVSSGSRGIGGGLYKAK